MSGQYWEYWTPPTKEQFKQALCHVSLTLGHKRMLKALYFAPQKTLTSLELSIKAGYKPDEGGANLQLPNIGKKILEYLNYPPPLHDNKEPFWSSVICDGYEDNSSGNERWYWILKSEVSDALEELRWVEVEK